MTIRQYPPSSNIRLISNRIKSPKSIRIVEMVDSVPVSSRDHFVTVCGEQNEDEAILNNAQRGELYDIWLEYTNQNGERDLFMVPEWFSENEFGARRPFIIASVEHDDPDSGAILFSDCQMVNISVVENQALGKLKFEDSYDELDISDGDDYIDESSKTWVPRSLMTVFRKE